MKKEFLLIIASVVISIAAGLGLIRWLAPQLLGLPADLQLVQVSEKRPPFFAGVFRAPGWDGDQIILKDPVTRVRARPFYPEIGGYGPNDMLGFRNSHIPATADIVVIGDSQTYGNNARIQNSWPQQMRDRLMARGHDISLYSMATGGWGAVQYLEMMDYATQFRPQYVVVAFYTGNDPMDSFMSAYGIDHWQSLRVDPQLSAADAPRSGSSLGDESARWKVAFRDGVRTEFNPRIRLVSNQSHPAIDAAYRIMLVVAEKIVRQAKQHGIEPVFTIIPTKEYVFQDKIRGDDIAAPDDYRQLLSSEDQRITWLANALRAIDGARYIDVCLPLRRAALHQSELYPDSINGHPLAAGYAVIGEAVATGLAERIQETPVGDGAVGVMLEKSTPGARVPVAVGLKQGHGIRLFQSAELAAELGWKLQNLRLLSLRQYQSYERLPDITRDNAEQYRAYPEQ